MPAFISHYLLAERIYEDTARIYPALYRNAFLWGASGPDIFFAHRIMPWNKKKSLSVISHMIHNCCPEDVLNMLMKEARRSCDPVAVSYALGFVTHYAFDSIAHPYIVGYAEKNAQGQKLHLPLIGKLHKQIENSIELSSVYHNNIEGCLDTIFLLHEKGIHIRRFHMEDACPGDKECYRAIPELLDTYIRKARISERVNQEEVKHAMTDWHRCLLLLNDSHSVKRGIFRGSEKLLHIPPVVSVFFRNANMDHSKDYANLSRSEWRSSYDGSMHTESFFDLADRSAELSLRLMRILLAGNTLCSCDCPQPFSGHADVPLLSSAVSA